MKTGSVLLLLPLLPACIPISGQLYHGRYHYDEGTVVFVPKGLSERWCLNPNFLGATRPAGIDSESADVVLKGTFIPDPGEFCDGGAYDHGLNVSAIVDIKDRSNDP